MPNTLTIVMYHCIKDPARDLHPEIAAMPKADFEGQLKYIKRHYTVISGQNLLASSASEFQLPEGAALLTFDDGFAEHCTEVLPALDKEGLKGCFFPIAKSSVEGKLCYAAKLNLAMASPSGPKPVADYILGQIGKNREAYGLQEPEAYWKKFAAPDPSGYFKTVEARFCHNVLLRALPFELRQPIADELYSQYVGKDEATLTRELYMSLDQVRTLVGHGMYVGSHAYNHPYLNSLPPDRQEEEVDRSLAFIGSMGSDTSRWIMCYPHGMYNSSLLQILKSRNCSVGLTTEAQLAHPNQNNVLFLPRLDAGELPTDADAQPSWWTTQATKKSLLTLQATHDRLSRSEK